MDFDPAFAIAFEELPLTFDGVSCGLHWGTAKFDASGNLVEIDVQNDRDEVVATLHENDAKPDSRVLFRMLKVSLLRRHAATILDKLADLCADRRAAAADHQINLWKEAAL